MNKKTIRVLLYLLVVVVVGIVSYKGISYLSNPKGVSKIAEKQLEVNGEESDRTLEAVKTGNTILNESDADFDRRLQYLPTSQGGGSSYEPASLQNNEPNQPEYSPIRQQGGEEAEIIDLLSEPSVLQGATAPILFGCKKPIVLYDDVGPGSVTVECLD